MHNLQITENPKNLEKISELIFEIYENTPVTETKDQIQKKLEDWVRKGGLILSVSFEEFDFPLAFAQLDLGETSLKLVRFGVKENFRNQGIWESLYDFIEFYAENKQFKYLEIEIPHPINTTLKEFLIDKHFIPKKMLEIKPGIYLESFSKEL